MIQQGVDLVIRFEGFSPSPYLCPAGVWTIGYGTTVYPWVCRVTPVDRDCTREKAAEWLLHELEKAERSVVRLTRPYLNEIQRAALASFVYNLGAGAFRASTLRRRINSGDWDDVPYQLSRWNKAGGRVLKGLVLRRKAEANLWLSGTML
jgi:lysozyme